MLTLYTTDYTVLDTSLICVKYNPIYSMKLFIIFLMITIIITTVYSRDLRYKETMMKFMMKLPDDMFRSELLPYLTVDDIVKLDSACLSHKYRPQLLDKIDGVILIGDKDKSILATLFKWLGLRGIYLIKINIVVSDFYLTPSSIENNYVDQVRYTKQLVLRGPIRDDMAIFMISHCPCLLSVDIGDTLQPDPLVTDLPLLSIAVNCRGLQLLSLKMCRTITDLGLITILVSCSNLTSLHLHGCHQITDASIITISTHYLRLQSLDLSRCHQITDASIMPITIRCTGLQSLGLCDCRQITDISIISMSTHCTGLQSLNLEGCGQITDDSIISISIHCTGLQSLNLFGCNQSTDTCVISISTHCTGLQSLNLGDCRQITDDSIISISTHCSRLQSLHLKSCHKVSDVSIISISIYCSGLQSLNLDRCRQISDASIISISENCTGLEELCISETNITDASLIAIAKNCTRLHFLDAFGCNGLSSEELRPYFHSVSDLRAVLLSIYPSLPI